MLSEQISVLGFTVKKISPIPDALQYWPVLANTQYPNASIVRTLDNFTVTCQPFISMLTSKLLFINSVYLSTSCDTIWTTFVQVFCAEV